MKSRAQSIIKPKRLDCFFDTEFADAVNGFATDLISIGIAPKTGKDAPYYGVSNAFNL